MIKGHGNDIHDYETKILADFSSNIVSDKAHSTLLQHLSKRLNAISDYPEPDAATLQEEIARHHHLDGDNIIAANGSTEAFYLIAHLFQNKRSIISTPSFAEYEDACKMFSHSIEFIEETGDLKSIPKSTDVLWLGNPNNPDGKILSSADIAGYCRKNPDVYVVVDEAYGGLCEGFESSIPFVNSVGNLIIVCSLTKAFAIPGLRLGYIVTNKELQQRISGNRIPWSVNSMALESGLYILNNYEQLVPDSKKIVEQSYVLQAKLDEIENLEVINSRCNFFLVKLQKGKASSLKKFLVERYGILIRDAGNFRGLDSSYFRVAVQKSAYNEILIKGIQDWVNQF